MAAERKPDPYVMQEALKCLKSHADLGRGVACVASVADAALSGTVRGQRIVDAYAWWVSASKLLLELPAMRRTEPGPPTEAEEAERLEYFARRERETYAAFLNAQEGVEP